MDTNETTPKECLVDTSLLNDPDRLRERAEAIEAWNKNLPVDKYDDGQWIEIESQTAFFFDRRYRARPVKIDQEILRIPNELIKDGSLQKDKPGKVRTLPSGTIVKIAGIPLRSLYEITLETSSGNWEAIKEWEEGPKAGRQQSTLPPSNGE